MCWYLMIQNTVRINYTSIRRSATVPCKIQGHFIAFVAESFIVAERGLVDAVGASETDRSNYTNLSIVMTCIIHPYSY